MEKIKLKKYDLAIIGGGPAGLMAASRASMLGAKVILLEKNQQPGIKLLATGGGRCNITNYIEDYKLLAASLGKDGRFLLSAFSRFGASAVVNFFEALGLKTKIEKNNQVFPLSDKARDVLKILVDSIIDNGGEIKTNASVKEIIAAQGKIEKLILSSGQEISARNYVLATGGQSYPSTGSTGDGYKWLKSLGHNIIAPRPALTSINVQEKIIKNLEGLSLSKIEFRLFKDNKKFISVSGDIMFTASGLSGPASLNLSRYLDNKFKNYRLELDFFPDLNDLELHKKLQQIFFAHGQKSLKNSLSELLPPKLIPVIIKLSQLEADKKVSAITKEERQALVNFLKNWSLAISGIGGFEKAMLTVGGLDLKEVDPKTMRSKIISNLFIAGELLNIDGPTGGYNLQICWSTGYVAGESAAN